MWIYNLSDSSRFTAGNPWSSLPMVKEEDDSSSSSIGNNSDLYDSTEDHTEVQSNNNNYDPLNGLTRLEDVLPIKRGISSFYAGKSKSYGSLADASSAPSIQDIVKAEDAYTRKRKNILAHNVLLDKNRKPTTENGIPKRLNLNNAHDNNDNSNEKDNSNPALWGRSLPPLPRNNRKPHNNESSDSSRRLYSSQWRSLSLSDLQQASAATSSFTGSMNNKNYMEDGR